MTADEELTIYTDWYRTLNIECIEQCCSIKFTSSTCPPLEVVSWDENFVYFKSRAGLYYKESFHRFMDCLNFARGHHTGCKDTIHPPYFRESILETKPPFSPKDIESDLYCQEHGLLLWGLRYFIDMVNRKC